MLQKSFAALALGATSVYLASGGQRFAAERQAAVADVKPIEAALRALFAEQMAPAQGATARMLSLMAWVLLDLDALTDLRAQIDLRTPTAHDSVAAFSRLIAGQVELIFHVADAAQYPGISRLLVALVYLLQGKEAAGQERAVGAQLFASGASDEAEQQRIIHLIDAQERSLRVFEEFASDALRARWQQHQLTPNMALLERLRRTQQRQQAAAVAGAAPGVDRVDRRRTHPHHDLAASRNRQRKAAHLQLLRAAELAEHGRQAVAVVGAVAGGAHGATTRLRWQPRSSAPSSLPISAVITSPGFR